MKVVKGMKRMHSLIPFQCVLLSSFTRTYTENHYLNVLENAKAEGRKVER